MGKPAARITDLHACPMVIPGTPPVPHVGGPIIAGSPNVRIGGQSAAAVGDMAICTPVGLPDCIISGSSTVLINGRPAASVGDSLSHGGVIATGCPTVLIGGNGESSSGGMGVASARERVPAAPTPLASGLALTEPKRQAEALKAAARTGTPFCEPCQKAQR